MSHELRTPLNSIIGYASMIENGMGGPLTEKQLKYIHNVSISGSHLLNLVNDLLDVSKVEAGKMDIVLQQFEALPLIEEIKSITSELAGKKKINLFFELQPGLRTIEADPSRFKQILINLINNAIKFNRENGSVWIRLYLTDDNCWLTGEIEDTGIGLSEEQCVGLFKKFYQADTSCSRKHEGTGRGLALTKELVELHNGSITVASQVNIGSKFTFKLPTHHPASSF